MHLSYTGVEYCVVYLSLWHSRATQENKRTTPHFLFYIDSILELGGLEFTVMLYIVKKTFSDTMVLEEYDTGKEVTVQLLNGTSVYDMTHDALALIKGIISNDYSIVCYNNGDYLMQDMKTNKQIYLSELIKETAPITEQAYVLLYDWVTKR